MNVSRCPILLFWYTIFCVASNSILLLVDGTRNCSQLDVMSTTLHFPVPVSILFFKYIADSILESSSNNGMQLL